MCKMANRIKKCRTQQKMTQEELAQKLGLKKSAIAKYENGRVDNRRNGKNFWLSPFLSYGLGKY